MKRPGNRHTPSRRPGTVLLVLPFLCATPDGFAADVFKGKTVYRNYCEACHGQNGQGAMPGTPNFSRGQGLLQTDLALFNRIRAGKNAMPAFQGVLETEQMLDVITYLRTFF